MAKFSKWNQPKRKATPKAWLTIRAEFVDTVQFYDVDNVEQVKARMEQLRQNPEFVQAEVVF